MSNDYWPVFDLRLAAGDLTLRPMTEADLGPLADQLPADVEQDPQFPLIPGGDARQRRGTLLHQFYWNAQGSWRPQEWRLSFVVRAGGGIIGVQELEGRDFVRLRTVDTSSYLIESARGRGLGKLMRRAVLALGFGPLEAQAAVTSAWHDNAASLGVSRALGYQPNGEHLHPRGGRADVMVHMRLRRADWLAGPGAAGITITGFGPCRPFFGLSETQESAQSGGPASA